jgi:hypothetical protein
MADSLSSASDADLLAIASQAITPLTATPAQYGIVAADVTDLQQKRDDFDTDLTAHVAAQANAKAKTAQKQTSRGFLEEALRRIRNIAKATGASDTNMQALGIPQSEHFAPTTATIPAVSVDTSKRLQHTISWSDAAANGNKKRPRGAMGAEFG